MSQHDFNIANQSFPATRTDLNNALVALASNSSGDAEPATKYANQWWYETDTNTLKLRNEANDAWISIAVLDQSGNSVQSITTAGLTLGSTAISATGAEINELDAITRGSILYGNASGATARLAAGGASTVLTSDGTDISWAAASGGSSDRTLITTVTASNNATLLIEGIDSTYDHYQVILENVAVQNDTNRLFVRVKSGGSIISTSNYQYRTSSSSSSNSTAPAEEGNDSTSLWYFMTTGANSQGNAAGEELYLTLDLFDTQSTDLVKGYHRAVYGNYTGHIAYSRGVVGFTGGAITGLQWQPVSGGNIVSGTFKLYGLTY